MLIEKFQFILQVPGEFKIPSQVSAIIFRRAFGHAFRRISCMTRLSECVGCPLIDTCPYTQVFEVQSKAQYQQLPSPYIIYPGQAIQANIKKDVYEYCFNMTLIGEEAINQLPLIIYAWQRAFRFGLGKNRVPIELLKVIQLSTGEVIWSKDGDFDAFQPQPLTFSTAQPSIKVEIKTPLKIKWQKRFVGKNDFNLAILMHAIFRRNRSIIQAYFSDYRHMEWEDKTDIEALKEAAHHVQLHWNNWKRYRNREGHIVQLNGLMGSFELAEDTLTQPQWQHLQLAKAIHVGSHTILGMGQLDFRTH